MDSVISLSDVSVIRGNRKILADIDLQIQEGEHWVVLGANGAGKTTLVSLLGTLIHPSAGALRILGEQIGLCDVFELRPRIGLSSAALSSVFESNQKVLEIVLTASYGMQASWKEQYETSDLNRARLLLDQWGIAEFETRMFGTLSEGERKRVAIARALMPNPELLILDEPAAGLDIVAREKLTQSLSEYMSSDLAPNTVLVTHHVEEIPPAATHVLMLNAGNVVAQGPIAEVLNSGNLTATFGMELVVGINDTKLGRRWSARIL